MGGFLDEPIPKYITDNKAMIFTFGGNGFFGMLYSYIAALRHVLRSHSFVLICNVLHARTIMQYS